MTLQSKIIAALVAALTICVFWIATPSGEVHGQIAPAAKAARYQISAWSHAGSERGASMHGAYIIDSESGKVWSIINEHEPKEIGVAK